MYKDAEALQDTFWSAISTMDSGASITIGPYIEDEFPLVAHAEDGTDWTQFTQGGADFDATAVGSHCSGQCVPVGLQGKPTLTAASFQSSSPRANDWTPLEDAELLEMVKYAGEGQWPTKAKHFSTVRSESSLRHRWLLLKKARPIQQQTQQQLQRTLGECGEDFEKIAKRADELKALPGFEEGNNITVQSTCRGTSTNHTVMVPRATTTGLGVGGNRSVLEFFQSKSRPAEDQLVAPTPAKSTTAAATAVAIDGVNAGSCGTADADRSNEGTTRETIRKSARQGGVMTTPLLPEAVYAEKVCHYILTGSSVSKLYNQFVRDCLHSQTVGASHRVAGSVRHACSWMCNHVVEC
eukprot:SAG31_NODE_3439_length_4270_cov_5.065452_2_plen_353_part_00